jgi:hypothetical protein
MKKIIFVHEVRRGLEVAEKGAPVAGEEMRTGPVFVYDRFQVRDHVAHVQRVQSPFNLKECPEVMFGEGSE